MKLVQTAERISHIEASDNVIFQRSLYAYKEAAKRVGGRLLEIGTGMGYGLEIMAPAIDEYIAVDKYSSQVIEEFKEREDFSFIQASVPPLHGVDDNSVDHVISFQVIEHIKDDDSFVSEIHRVLKPGGTAILTTPNIKMSLTRNPWHIREYTAALLKELLSHYFNHTELMGVFGNDKAMAYFEENKRSVQKFKRFDIFNLEYNLPRQLFRIPYDILNRMNRNKLLKKGAEVTSGITTEDYHLALAEDDCFDLFAVAKK